MTRHDPQRLNFNEPRALTAVESRLLMRWHHSICERLSESWGTLLFAPISVRVKSVLPLRYRQALKDLADPGVGAVLDVADQLFPSLLAFPGSLILGLLGQMLGTVSGEWPSPRNLTTLEMTMSDVLIQSILDAASDGWPGIDRLRCQFVETCRPRRCRRLPAEAELIACSWEVTCGHGASEIVWLLPRAELEQLLATEDFSTIAADHREDLEDLVLTVPIEILVELGRTELSVAELGDLQAGDVLVLDQSLHRPLSASIGGKVRWTGLPCRIGRQQGLQVTQPVDNTARGTP
ncbi:MAG: FliM/FliN family flagellar motor switch protein [Planctomycetaceae bacterium]